MSQTETTKLHTIDGRITEHLLNKIFIRRETSRGPSAISKPLVVQSLIYTI